MVEPGGVVSPTSLQPQFFFPSHAPEKRTSARTYASDKTSARFAGYTAALLKFGGPTRHNSRLTLSSDCVKQLAGGTKPA